MKFTISEYAKKRGVSYQYIHKLLKSELKPYIITEDGKTYLDAAALDLIPKDSPKVNKPSETELTVTELVERLRQADEKAVADTAVIENLREVNRILQTKVDTMELLISEKNERINDLREQLTAANNLTTQAQELALAQTQRRGLRGWFAGLLTAGKKNGSAEE